MASLSRCALERKLPGGTFRDHFGVLRFLDDYYHYFA
jgi:hypothetical protein